MKVTLNRAAFANALAVVTPASTQGGGALPVLTGVRIDVGDDNVALTCSDLDLTITTALQASIGTETGVCIPPAQLLSKILRASKAADVTLDHDGDTLTVQAGRATTRIRCLHADEWPRIGDTVGDSFTIPASMLAVLDEARRYASADSNRPVLTGVHLADGHIDATDSFVAYRAPVADLPDDLNINVPATVIGHLVKATGDVTGCSDGRTASFTVDGTTYTTRLIEGNYPNVAAFVRDTSPVTITVDADELGTAVREVVAVQTTAATPVRLNTVDGQLVASIIEQDVGDTSVTVDVDGVLEHTVAFNPKYLAMALGLLAGPVAFGFVDSLKPVVINDDRACRILMPVKIKS